MARSRAMGAGDRKEAGAGSGKKRKEASASDVKEASASDVLQPAAKKTAKWTIAKWRMHGIECEGGEVLRRKKEADDASPLWTSRDVPGAVELWLEQRKAKAKAEAEAEAAGVKKRKKVFKSRLPNALVEHMIESPYRNYPDLSEEELAERSASYRQLHALRKFIDDKMMYYEQALIDQYHKQGYAEDETEVTDDEEEEEN